MTGTQKRGRGRRDGLLDSACRIFAEKGFRDATVAEICRSAGANIAAVNYYFGGKKKLYAEAWRRAFQRSIEAHPPDGRVPPGAPPERRLRGRVRSLLERVADRENREFDMLRKEMANPTGLLAGVIRESLEPMRREMEGVIRELLGPGASEESVRFCLISIIAQCLHPMVRRRRSGAFSDGKACRRRPPFSVDRWAEHVAAFSLAGIRDVRRARGNDRLAVGSGVARSRSVGAEERRVE